MRRKMSIQTVPMQEWKDRIGVFIKRVKFELLFKIRDKN